MLSDRDMGWFAIPVISSSDREPAFAIIGRVSDPYHLWLQQEQRLTDTTQTKEGQVARTTLGQAGGGLLQQVQLPLPVGEQ